LNGGTEAMTLSRLAHAQIKQTGDSDGIAVWYALLVDCEPSRGLPEVKDWLAGLDEESAKHCAQVFITALIGGRYSRKNYPNIGNYKTPEYLTKLYGLIAQYIKQSEDINRAGGGVYSPGLRDDAQDARDILFKKLTETPGKDSYIFIKELACKQTNPQYQQWILKQANKRAEIDGDGDIYPWTSRQFNEFSASQTFTPATHRQLYDLAVLRLKILKNWLEEGNDSPSQTWQRVDQETEMRNVIAGQLNLSSKDLYSIAQEAELANRQRTDITFLSNQVQSPVPVELKLLDKKWSGEELCERLRNQLVGGYMREHSAACGVLLLIWTGSKPCKKWIINGKKVALNDLALTLKNYWQSISGQYAGIDDIDVILINLGKRMEVSNN
jgi:hypothetical protein